MNLPCPSRPGLKDGMLLAFRTLPRVVTILSSATASTAALTIVPRHVLGGPGPVAPSATIHICLMGCGTLGLGHRMGRVQTPDLQGVAVCDRWRTGDSKSQGDSIREVL